jgi:transcriptional regulator with XRE-family HTH domain
LECKSLGQYLRLPVRVGKPVTQEEVAEAAGISRQWYAMMESDRPVRVSGRTLGQIADVLAMSPEERAALFRLAVPEIGSASISERSSQVLDALGSLRRVTRRLWRATTEAEALTVVSEALAEQFQDADFMGSYTRVAAGQWQFPVMIGSEAMQKRVFAALADLFGGLRPEQIDEVMLSRLLIYPGQVGTRTELYANWDLGQQIMASFDKAGLPDSEFLMGHVRSRSGFEANLYVAYLVHPRTFSEIECAQVSTLADLTSLALS